MRIHLVRQVGTCSTGYQYYTCAIGPYSGCCSTDPCTSGVCPDDEGNPASSLLLTSTSPYPQSTASTSLTPISQSTALSTQTTATSSSLAPSSFVLSSTAPTLTSSTASTTASTSAYQSSSSISSTDPSSSLTTTRSSSAPSTRPSSTKGALIGGVIGGLAGALLLAALLYFCCRRRGGSRVKFCITRNKGEQTKEVDCNTDDAEEARGHNDQRTSRDPFAEFGGSSRSYPSKGTPRPIPNGLIFKKAKLISYIRLPQCAERTELPHPSTSTTSRSPASAKSHNS